MTVCLHCRDLYALANGLYPLRRVFLKPLQGTTAEHSDYDMVVVFYIGLGEIYVRVDVALRLYLPNLKCL